MSSPDEKNSISAESPVQENDLTDGTAGAEKEEQFPVIQETVKKRPLKTEKIVRQVLTIIAGAVLFGIIAAFVFARFYPNFVPETAEPVAFEQDPTPTPTSPAAETEIPDDISDTPGSDISEPTGSIPAETGAAEPTETNLPSGQDNPDPQDNRDKENDSSQNPLPPDHTPENEIPPSPTPTPDPAQESAERIRQNRLLYNDLRMLSSETARAVVTVTGITTTEDWFDTTDEVRRQTMGVIVADNGVSYLVLAQYSAIADASNLYVTLYNNAIVECSLVREDPSTGLGILRVQKRNIDESVRNDLQIAVLGNSYNIGNGEPVIAVGAPMGYAGAVDYGQVTSMSNRISVADGAYPLVMTNIQGAPNGSGVLINLDGEVIGIIAQQYALTGGGSTITALPISPIKRTIEILSNNQKFAWLGIVGEDVTTRISSTFNLPVGIYVTEVMADSPAFAAGIRRGDIIVRVGDNTVTEMTTLGALLNNGMAGTGQTFALMRLGSDGYVEMELEVEIGEI